LLLTAVPWLDRRPAGLVLSFLRGTHRRNTHARRADCKTNR
jgi:hypothetical protein